MATGYDLYRLRRRAPPTGPLRVSWHLQDQQDLSTREWFMRLIKLRAGCYRTADDYIFISRGLGRDWDVDWPSGYLLRLGPFRTKKAAVSAARSHWCPLWLRLLVDWAVGHDVPGARSLRWELRQRLPPGHPTCELAAMVNDIRMGYAGTLRPLLDWLDERHGMGEMEKEEYLHWAKTSLGRTWNRPAA
jgi:hypothetical protein